MSGNLSHKEAPVAISPLNHRCHRKHLRIVSWLDHFEGEKNSAMRKPPVRLKSPLVALIRVYIE
jgi:hypothetical protein